MKEQKETEIKKIWYKSKTIIVNGFLGLLSLFNEFGGEIKDTVQNNLPFLKDVDAKWYIYAVIFLVVFNIINRKFTSKEIVVKPKKIKEIQK